MKRAVMWIRTQPHYRREAFAAGLEKLDYKIMERVDDPRPGDALVSWNLYPSNEPIAAAWRKAGAKVLIAENGYIGKDRNGHQLYALSRDGHNGSGTWFVGAEDRWSTLGITLGNKETLKGPVIVRPQRGIGTAQMASPPRWARDTVAALQRGGYKVEHRQHPGSDVKQERDDPDEKALARAGAVVVWSSSFGVKAVISGLPIFYAAPIWIMADVAHRVPWPVGPGPLALSPWLLFDNDSRIKALRRLAWAQWTVDELASGQPFKYLLEALP